MKKNNVGRFYFAKAALLLGLLVFSAYGEPSIAVDSMEYIQFSPIRPPLYPIFLWIFSLFGEYQFIAVKWAQFTIMAATLFYTWHWLCSRLSMSPWLAWLIVMITTWNIVVRFEVVASILSEGLAVPLFILCVTSLVDCFKKVSFKRAMFFILVINLLVLTRAQFYYMYMLFPLLATWYFIKNIPKSSLYYVAVIMASTLVGAMIVNHSYHYYFNGHFSDASIVGPQIIAAPLYLSSSSAEQYITNPEEKVFFQKIMKLLEDRHLTRDTSETLKARSLDTEVMYYRLIFPELFHFVYYENLKDMSSYQLNTITENISKKLYLVQFKENIRFYIWKGISIFGGFPLFIGFILVGAMYLLRIVIDRNYDPDYFQITVGSFSLIILMNVFFVVLFVIASERYFIYSNFLIFCLGGILADKLFSMRSSESHLLAS
ncbi:MAG: hypothetical protein A3F11_02860 [Gammaproteobacteria bacterium RIFCSPHIGHO2_12_FULL_37_14]|nr:MAG: hypothetical protein A3F11_02860 [Gammaproteobacteria bacterium RIFCSPHIGHO2_12_FULL_37_14]